MKPLHQVNSLLLFSLFLLDITIYSSRAVLLNEITPSPTPLSHTHTHKSGHVVILEYVYNFFFKARCEMCVH